MFYCRVINCKLLVVGGLDSYFCLGVIILVCHMWIRYIYRVRALTSHNTERIRKIHRIPHILKRFNACAVCTTFQRDYGTMFIQYIKAIKASAAIRPVVHFIHKKEVHVSYIPCVINVINTMAEINHTCASLRRDTSLLLINLPSWRIFSSVASVSRRRLCFHIF